MDNLHRALDFYIHHKTVLGYSLVSLLTAASEHMFSSALFKCPCDSGNMLYGFVFLIVPAIILFLLGYLLDTRLWRLLTGNCSLKKCLHCRLWDICSRYFSLLISATARALVAPLTWVVVALFRASFYECAASGNSMIKNLVCKDKGEECHKLLFKVPCDEKLLQKVPGEFLSLQAQSQLIGWLVLTCVVTMALISKCIHRCISPVTYFHLKFSKIYLKKESELFDVKAEEHATKLAERNINSFFDLSATESFTTPSNEDWQMISSLYTLNSQEPYYSMIHKYINTKRGNSNRPGEGSQNTPGLGFVDETTASESGF
ncbi:CAHM6 protein, partial [Scopus umbretta]|nr:CAHM6 protein [Scopus umbretta]